MKDFRMRTPRVAGLTGLCQDILKGKIKKDAIKAALEKTGTITPLETISVLESMIASAESMKEKKTRIAKTLNILNEGLKEFKWEPGAGNRFLMNMAAENDEAEKRLIKIKTQLKKKTQKPRKDTLKVRDIRNLLSMILELSELEYHYLKKENILFPIMEKKGGDLNCLPVMWSIHDDVRNCLKKIKQLQSEEEVNFGEFARIVGELFFSAYAMIFRENRIIFPASHMILTAGEWDQMHRESFEIGFSFIQPEQKAPIRNEAENTENNIPVELSSGTLNTDVLELLINTLPLDITYIDEHNKVRYFSQPRDRIFTRSKAVLGRDVRNCHPPESLDKVDRIIESFRAGISDKESFRIYYRDRYVLIEYYALRKKNGHYKGTLEVTMDITDIREMEGEKRL